MYKFNKYFAEYLPVIKSDVLRTEHAQIPGYPLVKDHWYYIKGDHKRRTQSKCLLYSLNMSFGGF